VILLQHESHCKILKLFEIYDMARSAAFVMPPSNTAGFVIRQSDNVAITNCLKFGAALQMPLNSTSTALYIPIITNYLNEA